MDTITVAAEKIAAALQLKRFFGLAHIARPSFEACELLQERERNLADRPIALFRDNKFGFTGFFGPQMKSTEQFEQEFRNWHPHKHYPSITSEEYHAAVEKYVDKRLAWELENGVLFKVGMTVGLLFMWAIIGLILMYAVDRWRDKCITQIRLEISCELAELSNQRLRQPF